MEVRQELSYLITTRNQAGNSALNYSLVEPLVAEPGERFEIALNQISFPNTFPTITSTRNRVQMLFRYEGYGAAYGVVDGRSWTVVFNLQFPEGMTYSGEEICEFMNRSVHTLLEKPLTQKPLKNAAGEFIPTLAQELFSSGDSTSYLYRDSSYPDNYAIFVSDAIDASNTQFQDIGPLYCSFFVAPVFDMYYGRIRVQLLPQHNSLETTGYNDQGIESVEYLNTTDGYFVWHYPTTAEDGSTIDYNFTHAYDNLGPPTPNLYYIQVNMDTLTEGFRDNLAPFLGFQSKAGNKTTYWKLPSIAGYGIDVPTFTHQLKFYDYDVPLDSNTVISVCEFMPSYLTSDGDDADVSGDPKYLYFNAYDQYAEIFDIVHLPPNLYPYLLQVSLPQAVTDYQMILGEQQPLQQVIGTILLSPSSVEDRTSFYFYNRVYYSMQTNVLRDLQLIFFLDKEPYIIPREGMPIYVEVHIRRLFDPSSDRSRANAPLRADPYLGFRGFQGADPARLLMPSGSITHR